MLSGDDAEAEELLSVSITAMPRAGVASFMERIMHEKTVIQAIGLSLAVMSLSAIVPVWAAEQEAGTVAVQGVQVAIDPVSGQVVAPSDAQRQALSAAMRSQPSRLSAKSVQQRPKTDAEAARTLKRSSTGRYSAVMQLPESLSNSLVAEKQADGSIAIHHQGEGTPAAPSEVQQ